MEDVAGTLEELWVSYNQISSLDGLSACSQLTTLYISNNLIKGWNELDKIVCSLHSFTYIYIVFIYVLSLFQQAMLPNLRDVLFVGNPIYDELSKEAARIEVLKRLPNVAKIDGDMVKPAERDAALGISSS